MENVQVPSHFVAELMTQFDSEGCQQRKARRPQRRKYTSPAPNYVWYVDRYDNLLFPAFCVWRHLQCVFGKRPINAGINCMIFRLTRTMRCNLAMSILLLSGPMDWTDEHDESLMKEVRVQNPFQAKKKTTARAKTWQSIAEALSGLKDPSFKESLTKRSVQDRYSLVSKSIGWEWGRKPWQVA